MHQKNNNMQKKIKQLWFIWFKLNILKVFKSAASCISCQAGPPPRPSPWRLWRGRRWFWVAKRRPVSRGQRPPAVRHLTELLEWLEKAAVYITWTELLYDFIKFMDVNDKYWQLIIIHFDVCIIPTSKLGGSSCNCTGWCLSWYV